MRSDKFHQVFDFRYTATQWEKIELVIDSQPGKHDKKNIRETLERLAFQFLLVPKIETHVPRGENLVLAEAVIKCCDRLKTLLSETNVVREGSFYTAFGSPRRI